MKLRIQKHSLAFVIGLGYILSTLMPTQAKAADFDEGYQMGNTSAWNLVDSIERKTIDKSCRYLAKHEKALLSVIRNQQRPRSTYSKQTDQFVLGYYRGYLDAIRGGLEDGRWACGHRRFESGELVGEIYGAFLCNVTEVSVDLVTELSLPYVFDEWSGGLSSVKAECRTSAQAELLSCGFDDFSQLSLSIETSCSDRY